MMIHVLTAGQSNLKVSSFFFKRKDEEGTYDSENCDPDWQQKKIEESFGLLQ